MAIRNINLAEGMARKRTVKYGKPSKIWLSKKKGSRYFVTNPASGDLPPKNSELIETVG